SSLSSSHVADDTRAHGARTRVVFVDRLRFIAAFQMLQGHTVSALLAPSYRVGDLYAVWSAARGLTSVAFLFTAGLSFGLASGRPFASATARSSARRARVLRALRLIALGYVLHAPLQLLWDPSNARAAFERFVAVDVLQCIGVSLLALEALAFALRSSRSFSFAAAAVGGTLLALAPLSHGAGLPHGIADYLSSDDGSLFPLLPWSAHVFIGAACAAFVRVNARTSLKLMAAAFALLALRAFVHEALVVDQLDRLACVMVASAALALSTKRPPAWLETLAGQTLFLYVFHVLLVYGDGIGLVERIGPRLAPPAAIAVAGAVVIVSFALAQLYRRIGLPRADESLGSRLAAASETR
ncbi:MAG TPA: heparan-alpha-glucosaminide N-acetyltransferase domain-containing protein, partial [Polyangiales bacterium]|nr:heparan-alpha-glucosaminide N-acetyltransferase domain-containing protein [Polyangiales bacterium]